MLLPRLRSRKGVRGGPHLDTHASLYLLTFSHILDRDKTVQRHFVGRGLERFFCQGRPDQKNVRCRFCGEKVDGDFHLFLRLILSSFGSYS